MNTIRWNKIRNVKIASVWMVLFLASMQTGSASATDFNNASFNGTYVSIGIGRGGNTPTAGMTIFSSHGDGRLTGKTVLNVPAQKRGLDDNKSERNVVEFPVHGIYEIAGDGTGKMKIFAPPELGEPQTANFVITETNTHGWYRDRIATEIAVVFDNLFPTSKALRTSVIKRRPWTGPLSNASFAGTYTSVDIGRGGSEPGAAITVFKADGHGNIVGKSTVNRPSGKDGDREVITVPIAGHYKINADGMGTLLTLPTDQMGPPRKARFVITETRPHPRFNTHSYGIRKLGPIATSIWLIFDELTPIANALQTVEMKRRD